MTRVTMAIIAAELGLHQSTVSRALADHPQTAAAVKRQVRAAARRLGYQPDPALRALAQQRWGGRPAGVPVIARISAAPSPAIRAYRRGHARSRAVVRWVRERGYRIEDYELDCLEDPQALGSRLADRGVRLLLVGPMAGFQSLEELDWPWERFHCAADDRWWHRLELATFLPDAGAALELAWQQLRAVGHRRPGLALQLRGRVVEAEIEAAWRWQTRQGGPRGCGICRFRPEQRPTAILDWFRGERPDVIVGSHDGVYWDLIEAGVDVPRTVAVISLASGDHRRLVAGCRMREDCSLLALRHLEESARTGRSGLQTPTTTLVAPHWYSGESLPPATAGA
ncbi:MAG: hypothetical protein ACOCXJ_04255 [Planctomycetota bacterium]